MRLPGIALIGVRVSRHEVIPENANLKALGTSATQASIQESGCFRYTAPAMGGNVPRTRNMEGLSSRPPSVE